MLATMQLVENLGAESLHVEYKSLAKIKDNDGLRSLAETCVAFANADGGTIYIGVNDKTRTVPENQTISEEDLTFADRTLRDLCRGVILTMSHILTASTGGQYFSIGVKGADYTLATTSTGKVLIRHGDRCVPATPEDIVQILAGKGMRSWENIPTQERYDEHAQENMKRLAAEIRASNRCRNHVRQMSDEEMARHYGMLKGEFMTHLGILWLGSSLQRRWLSHPITVQYIVYDDVENKIRKVEWRDQIHNPKELLLDIESEAHELKYAIEFPDGLFRKPLRTYNGKVVRELIVNAFAHHSFETANDILISVYPDRLTITSPGGLPRGVTQHNILHTRNRRNPNMIELFQVLQLMEGEGSGYNLVYELNALEAKELPLVEANDGEVTVTLKAAILDEELLPLLDYIQDKGLFKLNQKAYTAFGLIVREEGITAAKLTHLLQLSQEEKLHNYVSLLEKEKLIISQGKKSKSFYVHPELIKNCGKHIPTSLKTLEPHVLRALILEDLRRHPGSRTAEIIERLKGATPSRVTRMVREMAKTELRKEGSRKWRRYFLIDKEEGNKI